MFVYTSKILGIFLDPYVLALLLLAGAILIRPWRVRLAIASFLVLAVLGCGIVSDALAGSLERQYPDRGIAALPGAPAIVVLGGAIRGGSPAHPASQLVDSSDRLLEALRLFRAGKAPLVVCSGGNLPLLSEPGELPEAEVMSGVLQEWGVPASAILTESDSLNTRENATNSYALLDGRGIGRILLVTSATHMPRAAAAFRKAGFEVIPAPADFQAGWYQGPMGWIPGAGGLIESAKAIRERVGLWVYRLRGWA